MADIIILLTVGLLAGVLSGLFGIGGGVLVVPCLVFFAGMTQHQAQGTSLAMMLLPVGLLAVVNYYKAGAVDIKAGLLIAAAFLIGGWVGSKVSLGTSEDMLRRVFGVLMLLVALKMIFNK